MSDRFKIVYNQDCTNIFILTNEPFQVRHVHAMVDEVADAGVDVMLINANGQRTYHPSEVRDTAWEEFDDYFTSDRKLDYWESVPDHYRNFDLRKNVLSQVKQFAESGHDYLAIALDRCREKRMSPGISIRMNDVHDAPWPDSYMHSRFYKDNPRFHLSEDYEGAWSRLALNYEFSEVREHYLAYVQELADNYSFDWLELDFLRSPQYFPEGQGSQRCDIMTAFVESVKSILDGTRDQVRLSARLAPSPAIALDLGFDVKTWAEVRLIDAVGFGNFFSSAWSMPVGAYRAAVGDDIALWPSTDAFAYKNRHERALLPVAAELINGFGLQYRDNGADGIELFNFFVTREPRHSEEADFAAVRDLSESSRDRFKIVIATSVESLAQTDLPQNSPTTTSNRAFPLSFEFLFPEPEAETGKMYVHLFLNEPGNGRVAPFRMNDEEVGMLTPELHQQESGDIVLEVKAELLKRGLNKLEIPAAIGSDDLDCIYITNYP